MKNKRDSIQSLLELYLNGNHTISQIYDIIVNRLKVPRPTVRREARVLRLKYIERLRILSENKKEKPSNSKIKLKNDIITQKLPSYYVPIDNIKNNEKKWWEK